MQISSDPTPGVDGEESRSKTSSSPDVRSADFVRPEYQKVEIQIVTLVMNAWSQVGHDIIYKNPYGIKINNTMLRMLDAINGLSINSEILLEELRKTLEAEKEAKEEFYNKEFDKTGLTSFLQEEYANSNEDWELNPHWARILFEITRP